MSIDKIKMKKKILISFLVLVFAGVVILCLKIAENHFKNNPFDFEKVVTKDDNFKGPSAGTHENDRDAIFHSLVVSPSNPEIIFVGTENNALFKSVDGGENWKWIRKGFWHNRRSYPEFYDIIIDPDNENLMYAALTNGPQTPDIEKAAGFYFSLDGGESWQRSVEGLPNTATTSLSMSIFNNKKILLVGLDGEDPTNSKMEGKNIGDIGGIYISDDKGSSWKATNIPVKGMNNRYSYIVSRGDKIYTSGHRFAEKTPGVPRKADPEKAIGLIKSTNGGETWKSITPPDLFCYYFDVSADGETIYFNTNDGDVYKSIDGGKNWEELSIKISNLIKISPYDSNIVIFANGNQVLKSEDGMKTQKKIFEASQGGFDDIEFTSDPKIIYAAGTGYRVYKSLDGGSSFSQIANLRDFIGKQ